MDKNMQKKILKGEKIGTTVKKVKRKQKSIKRYKYLYQLKKNQWEEVKLMKRRQKTGNIYTTKFEVAKIGKKR